MNKDTGEKAMVLGRDTPEQSVFLLFKMLLVLARALSNLNTLILQEVILFCTIVSCLPSM